MLRICLGLILAFPAALLAADDQPPTDLAAQKERLAKMQLLVGEWRGVGQPQRGSTKDSWIAEAQWAWSFDEGAAALVGALPKGRYFKSLKLTPGKEAGAFELAAALADEDATITYTGKLDETDRLI